jgi:hypothetical protein
MKTAMKKRLPREEFTMPDDYPVVSLDQAVADGTTPWTLDCVARRLDCRYPRQADQLRRVAQQLAANGNLLRKVA